MDESTFFTGQPVFNQLLKLIPRSIISELARKHQSDRYYKKFKSYDHLVTMLYATFHGCKSLREVTTGMMACTTRLNHLGINYMPRRSTLAEANHNRTERFFADLYHNLYSYFYPDSRMDKSVDHRLFIFDSTTIELFSEVMQGVGKKPVNGRRKGGVKAHVLTKADEDVPRFVYLTPARKNDSFFTDHIHLPAGSIVTYDRGYMTYALMNKWSKQGVTGVTRLRIAWMHQIVSSQEVSDQEKKKGIISDELILFGGKPVIQKVPARKIVYFDTKSSKQLTFVTNNTQMKASTIADIYKRRWQIECLFKRLKQNYPLKYFLGDSENAIKIQIWCSLITDILIKAIKDKVKRKWSFSNIASMIRLHLMTYIDLINFLQAPEKALRLYHHPVSTNNLQLFPT
jgi:hypothetical protein